MRSTTALVVLLAAGCASGEWSPSAGHPEERPSAPTIEAILEGRESAEQRTLGPVIERNGTVYTPLARDEDGCLLYNIHVPGGYAPAAMLYRDDTGRFVLGKPDRCLR